DERGLYRDGSEARRGDAEAERITYSLFFGNEARFRFEPGLFLLSNAGELGCFADLGIGEGDEGRVGQRFYRERAVAELHVGRFAVGADARPSGAVHEIGVAGAGELQPGGHHFVRQAMVDRLEGGAGAVRASEDVSE